MNILPTAYAPRQGESLGKYDIKKIDAIPKEVRNAINDGLNDIRFNGYRWECNAKTGWARVSPISSPADAEPESPEQSQADARADFLALQGEYLSVKPESKSEKKSAVDIVNDLRSKTAAKSSQAAPQQEAPEEPEAHEEEQDREESEQDNNNHNTFHCDECVVAVSRFITKNALQRELSPACMTLLWFMATKASRKDGQWIVWYSINRMAEMSGLGRATVTRALIKLESMKIITRTRKGIARVKGDTYRINVN
ncbi:TPA: helix-turn-helix domain-containing protein [Escherichia coli]|uniref:helix-turn-helix domain-containing protein n=1 Tax=Escherichia coli TaxID=562 RepID=UPI001C40439F|nr:helix-turn-helix domain-containing protein [Escherichia coli]